MNYKLIIPCIVLVFCFSGSGHLPKESPDALLCYGGGIVIVDVDLLPPEGRMTLTFDEHRARALLKSAKMSENGDISSATFEVSVGELIAEEGELPAVLKAADGSEVSLYLPKEWTVRFKEIDHIEMTDEERQAWRKLTSGETAEGPFQFTIVGRRISANARFEISSERTGQTDILLRNGNAPVGRYIEYSVRRSRLDEDSRPRMAVLYFLQGNSSGIPDFARILEISNSEGSDDFFHAKVRTPKLDLKFGQLKVPLSALCLLTDNTGDVIMRMDYIYLSHNPTAVVGAIFFVIIFYILIMVIAVTTMCSNEHSPVRNLIGNCRCKFKCINPLLLSLTPNNRFSISLAQISWWSFVIIFALVYTMLSSFVLLDITGQMLILLGISGGTAILAKSIAMLRIKHVSPKFALNIRRDRKPHFSDLVSIGNSPSIFKFQILASSLALGGYAIWEIVVNSQFPEFSENALMLMGISGGAYLANELATENVWSDFEKSKNMYDELVKKVGPEEVLIYDYIKGRKLITEKLRKDFEDIVDPDCTQYVKKTATGKATGKDKPVEKDNEKKEQLLTELCELEDNFVKCLIGDGNLRALFRIYLEIEELLQDIFDEKKHPSMTQHNMAQISKVDPSII